MEDEVVVYNCKYDILLEVYSLLGIGKIFSILELKMLVDKYDKSVV